MKTNEKLAGVLNDLIRINNDRIEGYQKAMKEADDIDVDLRAIFTGMVEDSSKNVQELSKEVRTLGEVPADGTTNSGKIYRVWMDIKNSMASNERKSILESCEYGEDAAQKAYNSALESDADMSAEVRQMITEQQSSLKKAHDLVKNYRDAHETVS